MKRSQNNQSRDRQGASTTQRVESVAMSKRYWKIEGYNSLEKIYEKKIPIHYIGENQIVNILKCLAAKGGLNFDEIVGAFARRRSKISNDLLTVWRQGPYQSHSCGENPHFTVRIIIEE